ncbi:MAG TPA: hypothetical protein EYG94_09200 [Campylobacterales bacterium]|nr:hypothetical protein [Campylobacterales bacterium]
MIRLLLLMSLLANVTYANSKKYFIHFGSFKDLRGLERSIDRLPPSLRSHVVIVRSNSWYIPFAYYTSNKNALQLKVPAYRRYFKDAHVTHSPYMLSHPLVRNYAPKKRAIAPRRQYIPPVKKEIVAQRMLVPQYQNVGISEADNTLKSMPIARVAPPIATQKVVIKQVETNDIFSTVKPKKYKNFSKQMLSGQHYYLAYKKTESNPNLLVEVIFGNHQVTYKPVIGEMKMTKANYLTENSRLYMFADTFTRDGTYSKLDEHRENHFLVSSWANGKKLNTLRYYYKMNDAKSYLGIRTSDGLAEVLSEGDYDDFFLDE